jgi:glycosyltransferase involved in cell wall biosynthesis
MVGQLDPNLAYVLFCQADILLVTLNSDETLSTTIPSKVQTYMKAARPIIASADGETARLVQQSGAGIAVPPGDGHKLAQAILRLYHLSSAERDELGRKARSYYLEHFESDDPARRLVKILSDRIWGVSQ